MEYLWDGSEFVKDADYRYACIGFDSEETVVKMLMDGTISIETGSWNSIIAFRTSQDALAVPTRPSDNGPVVIAKPEFKDDARIESILVWREQ